MSKKSNPNDDLEMMREWASSLTRRISKLPIPYLECALHNFQQMGSAMINAEKAARSSEVARQRYPMGRHH